MCTLYHWRTLQEWSHSGTRKRTPAWRRWAGSALAITLVMRATPAACSVHSCTERGHTTCWSGKWWGTKEEAIGQRYEANAAWKRKLAREKHSRGISILSFADCPQEFPHEEDTYYLAHCYPYTFTDLKNDLDTLLTDSARSKVMKREVMCETRAGNSCFLLTVTNFSKYYLLTWGWHALSIHEACQFNAAFPLTSVDASLDLYDLFSCYRNSVLFVNFIIFR